MRYCIYMHLRVVGENMTCPLSFELWKEYYDIYSTFWDRFGLDTSVRRVPLVHPPVGLYGSQGQSGSTPIAVDPMDLPQVRDPTPRMDLRVMAGESPGHSGSDEEYDQGKVQLSEDADEHQGSEYHMFRVRWWTAHLEWPNPRIPQNIQEHVSQQRRRERVRRRRLQDDLWAAGQSNIPQLPDGTAGNVPGRLPEWFFQEGLLEMFLVEFRFMCGVYPPWPNTPTMPFYRPNWRKHGWPACWDFKRPKGRVTPASIERVLEFGS